MTTDDGATTVLAETTFYLDPFRILLLAMVQAEGGEQAFIKAVQCSKPEVNTFEWAVAVACKTVRQRVEGYQAIGPVLQMVRTAGQDPWTKEDNPRVLLVTDGFVDYLAARWAPRGVANDPHDLNKNWSGNVKAIMRDLVNSETAVA